MKLLVSLRVAAYTSGPFRKGSTHPKLTQSASTTPDLSLIRFVVLGPSIQASLGLDSNRGESGGDPRNRQL